MHVGLVQVTRVKLFLREGGRRVPDRKLMGVERGAMLLSCGVTDLGIPNRQAPQAGEDGSHRGRTLPGAPAVN